jgi:hypothetical protein
MALVSWFDSLYSRLPRLGAELRDFIVKALPYLALIFGILFTFASVVEILGTPFFSIFTLGEGSWVFQRLLLVNIIGIFEGLLMLLAFKYLRRNSRKGWNLLFWSQILWIISSVISFSPSFILGFIFLYPLFQVKEHYR